MTLRRREPTSPSEPTGPPAIVCGGGNPAGVTIVQSLGPNGMPVHVLSNTEHAAAGYSRHVTRSTLTPLGLGGSRRSNNGRQPEELLDDLIGDGFQLCLPDLPTLTTALNKADLAEFCATHGFPLPEPAAAVGSGGTGADRPAA